MKKTIVTLSIMSMLVFTACSNDVEQVTQIENSQTYSLQDKAINLANDIQMIASDNIYINTLMFDSDILEIINSIASQDYSTPTNIYKLTGIDKSYKTILEYMGSTTPEFDNPKMEAIYKEKILKSLPIQLNAMSGANLIASTSLVTVDDVFLFSDIAESEVYILLYDGDYHVMVLFTPKGEGIVQASANIVAHQMLNEIQADGDFSASMKLGISFAGISLEKLI